MRAFFLLALTVLVLSATTTPIFAQSTASALFLLIAPGARASGMGEANVAVADDATAGYWNPAGLAMTGQRELTLMRANWLPGLVDDISYNFLGYGQYIEGLGGVGGHIIYMDLGEQVYTRNDPTPLDKFSSFMLAVAGSYASELSDNSSIGITVKFVHQDLSPYGAGAEIGSGTSSAFAFDVGYLSTGAFIEGLDFGAAISNIGPKMQFIDENQADPMPTNLKVGLSYYIIDGEYNTLMMTYDINKLLVAAYPDRDLNGDGVYEGPDEEAHTDPFYKAIFTSWTDDSFSMEIKTLIHNIGIEYWYSDMVALRAGLFRDYYLRDEEGNIALMTTFGAGLRYGSYGFDFGYVNGPEGHPLTNTMRFSLSLGF